MHPSFRRNLGAMNYALILLPLSCAGAVDSTQPSDGQPTTEAAPPASNGIPLAVPDIVEKNSAVETKLNLVQREYLNENSVFEIYEPLSGVALYSFAGSVGPQGGVALQRQDYKVLTPLQLFKRVAPHGAPSEKLVVLERRTLTARGCTVVESAEGPQCNFDLSARPDYASDPSETTGSSDFGLAETDTTAVKSTATVQVGTSDLKSPATAGVVNSGVRLQGIDVHYEAGTFYGCNYSTFAYYISNYSIPFCPANFGWNCNHGSACYQDVNWAFGYSNNNDSAWGTICATSGARVLEYDLDGNTYSSFYVPQDTYRQVTRSWDSHSCYWFWTCYTQHTDEFSMPPTPGDAGEFGYCMNKVN